MSVYGQRIAGPRGIGSRPLPPDIMLLLATVFLTFVLQFFSLTAVIPALLRLSPMVYHGAVWQLLTYAFSGFGPASLWFLFSLLMLYWFGGDIFSRLGRRRFWKTTLIGVLTGSLTAVLFRGIGMLAGMHSMQPFILMQGQYMLLAIFVAAWSVLYSSQSILLFFVLPIRASYFLWIEILLAFMSFLSTHDFAGFAGISAAVGITWLSLQPGGPGRALKNTRLRLRRLWIEMRLARLRKKRNFSVIDDNRF